MRIRQKKLKSLCIVCVDGPVDAVEDRESNDSAHR